MSTRRNVEAARCGLRAPPTFGFFCRLQFLRGRGFLQRVGTAASRRRSTRHPVTTRRAPHKLRLAVGQSQSIRSPIGAESAFPHLSKTTGAQPRQEQPTTALSVRSPLIKKRPRPPGHPLPLQQLGRARPGSHRVASSPSVRPPPGGARKMRMSCNGCRVLRKGCGDACTIRPCLQWIEAPEAQANATVFLAKFYGRAGLLNLLAAAPDDGARPAVFRSLLYEACGRIVNPVYGSVGLLWSRQWHRCADAVEAVLRGDPVVQVDAGSDAAAAPPLLAGARPGPAAPAAYDIRHVARDPDAAAAATDLLRVARAGRRRFKRAGSSSNASKAKKPLASPSPPPMQQEQAEEPQPVPMVAELEHGEESAGSHDHHLQLQGWSEEDTDVEAASHVSQAEAEPPASSQSQSQVLVADQEEEEVGLELTLGFEPVVVRQQPRASCCDQSGLSAASSLIGLRLQLPAA